jgi:hypothetical protein
VCKGQKGKKLKACNDSMKICFKHQTRMKVGHKIKNIIIVYSCIFIISIVIFEGAFFSCIFYVSACTYLKKSFIVVCTHLKCYSTNDIHLIMCALCEIVFWKNNKLKKETCTICLNVFLCIFSFNKKLILICVLLIWLSFVHHFIII